MALFSKADLPKSKYIVSIVAKIKKGTAIKVEDGKSYKFKKTKDIDMLERFNEQFEIEYLNIPLYRYFKHDNSLSVGRDV